MKVSSSAMSGSKSLRIDLLGPIEIRRGKRRVELPSSRKARALLAYLITTGREHRRDRLTELFWDVADDPKGGLRWCLSKIRPLVDEPSASRILADRETVKFSAVDAEIDVLVLRDNLRNGVSALPLKKLQEVAALFRGSFLEGLELPDHDGFQAWLVAERENILQQRVSILRTIAKGLQADPEAAVPYARLLVEIDPLDEHSRAQLSGFLIKLARHSEARQVLEAGQRLASEFGSQSGVLVQAERELSRPARSGQPRDVGADIESNRDLEGERPDWNPLTALVGRNEEIARLRNALTESKERRNGCVLLITGEPGVGKTRLLSELSSYATSLRGTALSGRSYEAEARRPYGPWIDAIRSLHPAAIGEVLRDNLAPILHGLSREDEGNGKDARRDGKTRLFAAIVELLAARAHSAPPVLLQFDDIQWCDEMSAELLHYVVRMMRHRPVSVVLTARDGELPDNEPIMRVLRGIRREHWLEEMRLSPLSKEDTAGLVNLVDPAANAQAIFDESAGNPLYAIELARAAGRFGKLADSTIAGLIKDRIDQLPATASDILRWAAVLGTEFSLHRLASLVSLGLNELMSALEVLDRHGLLRESPAGAASSTYGFTHSVVRRSVYDNLSEPRRRLMHWRIVQMLEGDASSSASPAEIEHHAALAGEAATAARASVAAGRYCLRVYANGEALAFARSGLRHSEALPERERVGLQIELMELSLAARRPKDTEETAIQLEALAEQALSNGDVEHARLGFHLLSYIRWEGGDWSDARRLSLRAEFVARGADTREQIVAMAEAARCLALLERDLGQAEALALEARVRATNAGFETVAIPDALGMLRFHQGAWDDAANLFQGARELSLRQGDRIGEFRALEHLIVLELERDRPEAARTFSRELVELAEKLREGSEAPFARCLAALAAEASGKDAARELDEGLESLRMADAKHRLAYALLRATQGDFKRGDIEKARIRGEEALELANILERPSETTMAHVALLRCALANGDVKEIEHHRDALRRTSMTQIAAHVRREAELVLVAKEGDAPWNS